MNGGKSVKIKKERKKMSKNLFLIDCTISKILNSGRLKLQSFNILFYIGV